MNISPIFDFSRFIENQYFWNTETNLINGSWWTGEQITNDIITVHTKYPLVRPPQQNYSGVKELSVRDWTHRFMVSVFKWWRRKGMCVAVLILFRIHWNQLPFCLLLKTTSLHFCSVQSVHIHTDISVTFTDVTSTKSKVQWKTKKWR